MRIDLISIFPQMFDALFDFGVSARAMDRGLIEVGFWNPRDFTDDAHGRVDDRPYGGGAGMVMQVEPVVRAIRAARSQHRSDVSALYLTPQGRRLDQEAVEAIARRPGVILVAGRYEGIDERIVDLEIDEEWSIGDYVLAGGELPAMALLDAVIRQIPGVLGNRESAMNDSFSTSAATQGLLDCSQFTRPELFEGLAVPETLLSGDHERIRRWRLRQAVERTLTRRPDIIRRLLAQNRLDDEARALVAEISRQLDAAGENDEGIEDKGIKDD